MRKRTCRECSLRATLPTRASSKLSQAWLKASWRYTVRTGTSTNPKSTRQTEKPLEILFSLFFPRARNFHYIPLQSQHYHYQRSQNPRHQPVWKVEQPDVVSVHENQRERRVNHVLQPLPIPAQNAYGEVV